FGFGAHAELLEENVHASVMLWPLPGSLEAKLELAAQAGFTAVGFVGEPSRWSRRELALVRRRLDRLDLEVSMLSATPNWRGGAVSGVDARDRERLLAEVRGSVELARELDTSTLIMLAGNAVADVPEDRQLANLIEAGKRCADIAARDDVTLVLEPL